VAPFVAPGINNKKEKDEETDDQKDYGAGLVFPKLR
jgi:hypothetical protein